MLSVINESHCNIYVNRDGDKWGFFVQYIIQKLDM